MLNLQLWYPMLLLPAFPDETLYSRCVRTREVYGMSAEQFFCIFFNNTVHSVHPYLNTSLNILSESTSESAYELLSWQTLIPLYAWALPEFNPELQNLAISAFKLQTICSLLNFAEYHPAILKHCPVCTYHDVKEFGVAYWHRQHQIFGITSCNLHQVRLNHLTRPRLSDIRRHLPQYKKGQISLSTENDFKFARFTSHLFDDICKSLPDFKNRRSSSLVKTLEQHIHIINNQSILLELYNLTKKLDHKEINLFPTQANHNDYWKTLLYRTSPQSPFKYLILLYCLDQISIK